jgi:hypothetical protein
MSPIFIAKMGYVLELWYNRYFVSVPVGASRVARVMRLHYWCIGVMPIVLLSCGYEGRRERRALLEEGKLSIVPPAGWVVVEDDAGGTGTVMAGEGGRLNVTLTDAAASSSEPRDLLKVIEAISPGFEIRSEDDFAVETVLGKEFIVSYDEGEKARAGLVYMFEKDARLCVLTFSIEDDEFGERLTVFRASAGSLRFRSVQ